MRTAWFVGIVAAGLLGGGLLGPDGGVRVAAAQEGAEERVELGASYDTAKKYPFLTPRSYVKVRSTGRRSSCCRASSGRDRLRPRSWRRAGGSPTIGDEQQPGEPVGGAGRGFPPSATDRRQGLEPVLKTVAGGINGRIRLKYADGANEANGFKTSSEFTVSLEVIQ
jgi:hypothetical protein